MMSSEIPTLAQGGGSGFQLISALENYVSMSLKMNRQNCFPMNQFYLVCCHRAHLPYLRIPPPGAASIL